MVSELVPSVPAGGPCSEAMVELAGVLAKGSDDQPRGDDGRWTHGSSSQRETVLDKPADLLARIGVSGSVPIDEKLTALAGKAKAKLGSALQALARGGKAQAAKTWAAIKTAGRLAAGQDVSDDDRASAREALVDVGRMGLAGALVAAPGGMLALAVVERAAKHFGGSIIPSGFRAATAKADEDARDLYEKTLDAILAELAGADDEHDARLAKADEDAGLPARRIRTPWQLEKARRKIEAPIERAIAEAMRERLERQKTAVLALVRGRLGKADKPKPTSEPLPAPKVELTDAQLADALRAPITKAALDALGKGLKDGGAAMADTMRIGFRESDPAVSEYLKARRTNIEDVLDEFTADQVKQALRSGYEEHETEEELTDRLANLGAFGEARAQRIARTETHAAVMSGANVAMKQANVEKHQWLAAVDARPSHREASGQVRPIDTPFNVGDAELMYPGDLDGPPDEVVNCFLPETMIQGRVIAGIQSFYRGPIVTIKTKHGFVLRVTAGHPILVYRVDPRSNIGVSRCFLIPARDVVSGDKVLTTTCGSSIGKKNPSESAASLFNRLMSMDMASELVVAFEDFHGDGVQMDSPSKMAVVPPLGDGSVLLGMGSVHDFVLPPDGQWNTADYSILQRMFFGSMPLYFRSDEVAVVESLYYEGQVYDFESPFGWLVAGGIVSSNCRCTTIPIREAVSDEDLAAALDLIGDEDLAADVRDAVSSDFGDDEAARIAPDDVDPLTVRAGDADSREADYDPERARLTVGGKAEPSDIASGVREHVVASTLEPADARAFMNQVALYDLPEPDVSGGERKKATLALMRIVADDRDGAEKLFGQAIDDETWSKLRVVGSHFLAGGGMKGPKAEPREREESS